MFSGSRPVQVRLGPRRRHAIQRRALSCSVEMPHVLHQGLVRRRNRQALRREVRGASSRRVPPSVRVWAPTSYAASARASGSHGATTFDGLRRGLRACTSLTYAPSQVPPLRVVGAAAAPHNRLGRGNRGDLGPRGRKSVDRRQRPLPSCFRRNSDGGVPRVRRDRGRRGAGPTVCPSRDEDRASQRLTNFVFFNLASYFVCRARSRRRDYPRVENASRDDRSSKK